MTEAYHHDHGQKLVRMANQIGSFFHSYPEPEAVAGVAEHINKFWTRRMRADIKAHAEAGGLGDLENLVQRALPLVK